MELLHRHAGWTSRVASSPIFIVWVMPSRRCMEEARPSNTGTEFLVYQVLLWVNVILFPLSQNISLDFGSYIAYSNELETIHTISTWFPFIKIYRKCMYWSIQCINLSPVKTNYTFYVLFMFSQFLRQMQAIEVGWQELQCSASGACSRPVGWGSTCVWWWPVPGSDSCQVAHII